MYVHNINYQIDLFLKNQEYNWKLIYRFDVTLGGIM